MLCFATPRYAVAPVALIPKRLRCGGVWFNGAMSALSRRPHPERSDCWHVFYGDVQVGTIAIQSGLPVKAKQWRWDVGFYPASHAVVPQRLRPKLRRSAGKLRSRWRDYLPRCTEADFIEHRRQRAWTAWKYAMQQAGLKAADAINQWTGAVFLAPRMAVTDRHVQDAHTD